MQKILLTVLTTSLLAACSSTQVTYDSSVSLPTQFEQNKNAMGSENIRQWWTFWNDTQLTQLIDTAVQNNKDIALAQARLEEAMAGNRLAEADKGISIGATGTVGLAQTRVSDIPLIGGSQNSRAQGLGAGVSASWEPDFFGKKQSDADAAKYAALSQQEQLYATQIAIASEIAQRYFQYNTLWQYHDLLRQQIAVLNQLQRYVQGRFQAGQATRYEVEEVQSQTLSLQAQQSDLSSQADSIQRQIAVLTGKTPSSLQLKPNLNTLRNTPAAPSGQMPGTVMERRPDVRAYSLAMQARAAQVASAKADLLPRFDIQFLGQGGRFSLSSDLSSMTGLAGIVSAGVQLPIFTNDRIQANIDAADARLKQSVIEYDQALLTALAEVESYYQMSDSLAKKVSLLERTVKQHQQQTQAANSLFKHGHKTLDTVLTSQLNSLSVQQELTKTRLQRQENMIGLYKALGGGW